MNINRRYFLASASALSGGVLARSIPAADGDDVAASRSYAMLIGSLIGDALGGPIEFKPPEQLRSIMPDARSWESDQVIDAQVKKRLAHSLQMFSYAELRPEPAAYGPWKAKAERGTITDDSRHKIVLMRGLRKMLAESRDQFTTKDVAQQFLSFRPHEQQDTHPELAALVEEGLREYRYASRWILGHRDPADALPVERLWSGIANCSGQMMMTPLAALFPGEPEKAYRETFRLDFIDAPIARDIASAINAGLAAALDPRLDDASTEQRWQSLLSAMRNTDPYRLGDVPFAGRPLHRWLDLAESIAQRSGGRPAKIYELLEKEGKPVYYWDAHFTLLVALTMLRACDFDPISAMHLTLDFGHDTDSYAQLLGAMAGAVHGMDIFPNTMCTAVETRLAADYGESVHDWVRTLTAAAKDWTLAPGI
jgi:ADP-ribosylglycohydrolase